MAHSSGEDFGCYIGESGGVIILLTQMVGISGGVIMWPNKMGKVLNQVGRLCSPLKWGDFGCNIGILVNQVE